MTTMAVVEQRFGALARANEVRMGRAQVKRDVRAGLVSVEAAMRLECCETMAVGELLAAQRGWGRVKARKLVQRVPCLESKAAGSLTERQRARIVELLGGAA